LKIFFSTVDLTDELVSKLIAFVRILSQKVEREGRFGSGNIKRSDQISIGQRDWRFEAI
jgi:hypothetical protein